MQKNSTEMSGTVQAFLNIIRERCGQPPEYDPRDSAGIDTFGEMGRRLIDKGVTPAVALHLEKQPLGKVLWLEETVPEQQLLTHGVN